MIEQHIDIPTDDGPMPAFVVHPEENGPHPVVLFYMDAPGKREELHQFARRIASVGYVVVLPNLYHRQRREYTLKERTPELLDEMFGLMRSLDARTTEVDTRAMLSYVDALPAADASRVGLLGYCMSGPFVVWAAAAFPDRIACIMSVHPASVATDAPDSPHLVVQRLQCESYHAIADNDPFAPAEQIERFQAGLKAGEAANGVPHRLDVYRGAEHGFSFPARPVYNRDASERHFERMFDLFERRLKR